MIVSIIGVVCLFILSTVLFLKASGTLALNKLNIISYVYYLLLLQVFIGSMLIYLGFDEHYTLNYLIEREESIKVTINIVTIMMITLPIVIIIFSKIFRFRPMEEFDVFLHKDIERQNSKNLFYLFCGIGLIQMILLVLLLIKTGYVPILKMIIHEPDFNFNLQRQINKNDIFVINMYVKNIILMFGIPIIGYITFAFALIEKKTTWIVLASIYFLASVIVKTYEFAKSPIIFHIFIYFLIVLYIKNDIIKNRMIIAFGMAMGLILVVMYKMTGYQGAFLDIYNGILGRTFFSQVGTLAYHFDLFSNVFEPLGGRSLPSTILPLFGMEPEEHLRSAKLVMDFYGSEHVAEGTAGVMNAGFLGEAYANWGMLGVAFSILFVGAFLTLVFMLVLRIKKTPVTVAMLAILTQYIGNMSQGGFTDFIYSFSIWSIIIGCLILIYFDEIIEKIKSLFIKIRKTKAEEE